MLCGAGDLVVYLYLEGFKGPPSLVYHGLLMVMLMPNVCVGGVGEDMLAFMPTADSVILT